MAGQWRGVSIERRPRILEQRLRFELLVPREEWRWIADFHGSCIGYVFEPDEEPVLRSGIPELEPGAIQDLLHYGAPSSSVPRGGFQLDESPELGWRQRLC